MGLMKQEFMSQAELAGFTQQQAEFMWEWLFGGRTR